MNPDLGRLQSAIASATDGMTAEDLTRRPAEGKWCAAEVLEHLYLTYTGTVKGFERCLKAGKPLATSPKPRQRVATLLTVGLGYMLPGQKAPERTMPRRTVPAETIVAEIGATIAAMDEAIAKCEAQYGTQIKLLDHPVLGPLTGKQWRKFHRVHGEHHVKQILRLRSSNAAAAHARGA
jgi:DinB superfamily